MAQKRASGFNKILNFIGLVEDEEPNGSYGEEYTSGNYGRKSAYDPRGQESRSRASSRDAHAQSSARHASARPNPNRTYGEGDEYRSGRSRFGYDRNAKGMYEENVSEQSRARSRFEEEPEAPRPSRREGEGAAAQPRSHASRMPRTVMFSLTELSDCSDVIDQLILGNTIVLTMSNLDGFLMQRAVDTLAGAVFALRATIRKASDKTYLIAPNGVQVNSTYDTDNRF